MVGTQKIKKNVLKIIVSSDAVEGQSLKKYDLSDKNYSFLLQFFYMQLLDCNIRLQRALLLTVIDSDGQLHTCDAMYPNLYMLLLTVIDSDAHVV